ncbi:hybrid sensor histidine kinase/response regulator [Desulfobulbus alkaliphilus]|uniref:hybrid sensor histidine kinase/response regulator n=1 Tax=Desulfobulbus alkaliphilus TaxID=869814 RepID=UPI00196285C0|nr:ATP-binding protein [Desulfobulbus alkaliphilus]MBM9537474.1 response regulator [Desulfobulbus alkaliphilus]
MNTALSLFSAEIGLLLVGILLLMLLVLNQRKKDIIYSKYKELADTEARYRLLFEHSPIPLMEEDLSAVKTFVDALESREISDLDQYFTDNPESLSRCVALSCVLDANRAALKMYGAGATDDLSRLSTVLPEDQRLSFKNELVNLKQHGGSELILENRRLDGTVLTVERRAVIAAGFESTWSKVFVTVIDISEQVRLRNENKAFEKQLRHTQKLEAIGSLAGGIAHDFNNILAPIMGRAELMLVENRDNPTIQGHCRGIVDASKRARDLVRQILTFSRQVDQEIRPVFIADVVREVVQLVGPTLPTTIEVVCHLPDTSSPVMADASQLHQVIMNLVNNAFHAMEKQGGRLILRLETVSLNIDEFNAGSSVSPGLYQKLSVEDTGHGMDQTTMAQIFDPYFTTKPRGKGTGLGLAVVLGILRGYGGEIRVESKPGKGTIFTLYLPVVELTTDQAFPVYDPEEPMPRGNEHILLVDDEKSIADVTTSMLERLGYKVTVRISSYDALEAFRNLADGIDLMIIDLTMPQMTGLQLYREIKKIRPDIKVIICTGFSEQLDSRQSRVLGIEGFLNKPVIMADLARCVRSVLDG